MNKLNNPKQKFSKKDFNKIKHYKYKKGNFKKSQYNNTCAIYNKKKDNSNENIYDEEYSYDKRTSESTHSTSTIDNSFSYSSKSISRKQSFSDNDDDNFSFVLTDCNNSYNDNSKPNLKIDNFTKINLSDNDLKNAYYRPKNYKGDSLSKNGNITQKQNENITILDIGVKISENKVINFKLRKYDDMFQVVKKTCKENELNENYQNFFVYTIIKALNSIYGIYNLSLKKEEISFLQVLKDKCNNSKNI
jgi:hypothetical protein